MKTERKKLKQRDGGAVDVIHTAYESVGDLLNVAQQRADTPTNRTPNPDHIAATEICPKRTEFTGTESLPAAIELVRNGWPEGTAKLLRGMESALSVPSLSALSASWDYDVGGEFPDVGAYCAGEPEHMVSPVEQRTAVRPVIQVSIVGSYHWRISAQEIENFGVALLSLLDAIQKSGRTLELEYLAFCYALDRRKAVLDTVPLTTSGAPFDVDRIAAALHPSFYRRLVWSRWDLDKAISDRTGWHYGVQVEKAPEFVREPNRIYLPGPGQLHETGELSSIESAANALVSALRRETSELFDDKDAA